MISFVQVYTTNIFDLYQFLVIYALKYIKNQILDFSLFKITKQNEGTRDLPKNFKTLREEKSVGNTEVNRLT